MTGTSADGHVPGWSLAYSGKVRDLWVTEGATLETASEILMVASDRVSAYDQGLDPAIPGKGATLTAMTKWWMAELGDAAQLVSNDVAAASTARVPETVRDRALLVKALTMLPIECVVRGRLTGNGLLEYRETGAVSGVTLPAGLEDGDELPTPIFTPAWKAPQGQHDENISFEHTAELVGIQHAETLRQRSLDIYLHGARVAAERGLVLADTKLEFGLDASGDVVLADEVLTADSSRYWDADALAAGRVESFDKQIVRNWLRERWDGVGTAPRLSAEVVEQTAARYRELLERLTGSPRVA